MSESLGRKIWIWTAYAFTFWIPSLFISKSKDRRLLFREKILWCIIMLALSAGVPLAIHYASYLVCGASSSQVYPLTQFNPVKLNVAGSVIINGKAVSLEKLSDTKQKLLSRFEGQDVSGAFPAFTVLGRAEDATTYADNDIQECVGGRTAVADRWLEARIKDPGYRSENKSLVNCPLPNNTPSSCFYLGPDRIEVRSAVMGDVAYPVSYVSQKASVTQGALIMVEGKIYDVTRYLALASNNNNGRPTVKQDTAFLGDEITRIMLNNLGKDATGELSKASGYRQLIKCMDKMFYAGVDEFTAAKISTCSHYNPVKLAVVALILLLLLPRHFMSFASTSSNSEKAELSDASLIVLMHVNDNDSEIVIKEAVDSLLRSRYRKDNILLLFCTESQETSRQLLSMLESRDSLVGTAANQYVTAYNSVSSCRVLGGRFKQGRNYIVIQKDISLNDKRDSLMIVMGYLNKFLRKNAQFNPLEFELHKRFSELDMDARKFEYLVMLDSKQVFADENQLLCIVEKLDGLERVGILVGNTCSKDSSYYFFSENHLTLRYKSALNAMTTSYTGSHLLSVRLKYSDGSPCALSDHPVIKFSNSHLVSRRNLAMKNCLERGKEHFVNYGLLASDEVYEVRYDPAQRTRKVDGSLGLFDCPSSVSKHINYRFNMNVKCLGSSSCNLPFGMKLWAVFEILMQLCLPGLVAYYYYCIAVATNMGLTSLVICALPLVLFVLDLIALLFKFQLATMMSLLIYITIGLPIYNIVYVLWAFATMDSFKHELKDEDAELKVEVPRYTLQEWADGYAKPSSRVDLSRYAERVHDEFDQEFDDRKTNYSPTEAQSRTLYSKTPDYGRSPQASPKEKSRYGPRQTQMTQASVTPSEFKRRINARETQYVNETDYRDSYMTEDTIPASYSAQTPQLRPESLARSAQKQVGSPHPAIAQSPLSPAANKSNVYYQPTNFNEKKTGEGSLSKRPPNTNSNIGLSPMKVGSMARSDYESDYSSTVDRTSRFNRDTTISTDTARQNVDLDSLDITKDDIRQEIRFMLQDADLNAITRREVKEHLFVQFGDQVEHFNDFINICIEEFTLEKLALL